MGLFFWAQTPKTTLGKLYIFSERKSSKQKKKRPNGVLFWGAKKNWAGFLFFELFRSEKYSFPSAGFFVFGPQKKKTAQRGPWAVFLLELIT